MFEKNSIVAEEEYQKLDSMAAYGERVEPWKYWIYLFLGLAHAAFAGLIIVHIFSYKALKSDGKNVNSFLNHYVEQLENSEWQWAASSLVIVIGWYLMACTAKGMTKLGLRFFFINFYPMKPKETFVNAFFANNLC